jgi:hypothetical protein
VQGLQEAGWAVGRNAQIDIRWSPGNAEQMRTQAVEMVALAPDVILASSPQAVVPLRDASRTIPTMRSSHGAAPPLFDAVHARPLKTCYSQSRDLGLGYALHEAARVHQLARRHGSRVAASGAGAAVYDGGHRSPQQRNAELLRAPRPRFPPEAKRPAAEGVDGLIIRLPQPRDFVRREKSY